MYDAAFTPWETLDKPGLIAAAALRAVADQVVPVSTNRKQLEIRFDLLRIATELEAQ